jgi:hypothetical protein
MFLPIGGTAMTFKKIVSIFIAFCIMATLVVAIIGCEDLGAYEDTEEYYSSFGDIVLIKGTSKDSDEYSVEKYFYNEDSREDFLEDEEGAYKGIEHSDYVYMAVPFESDIDMDTFALYLQSKNDVTVYINVFVTDKIPTEWKAISDNVINSEETDDALDEEIGDDTNEVEETDKTEETDKNENVEKMYDDPNPDTRVGEITVHLKAGKWNSFVLDEFKVDGKIQKSIEINEDQYVLLQIRNNSGVRIFDEENQIFIDPQTGLELQKAEIIMTKLLIRALDIKKVNETQGGE